MFGFPKDHVTSHNNSTFPGWVETLHHTCSNPEGDSTYVGTETISITRRLPHPSGSRYRLVFVFSTPEDSWTHASLCRQHFPAFTDMLRNMLERVVNGPGFRDMRAIDANMYQVLSLRGFNRGHPMIPVNDPASEESFNLSAGEHLGLVSWTRFKPHEKFHLSEYMRCFMERLGHRLKTYEVMDGRKLVAYQCAVVRQEWDELKTAFYQAFKVQKPPTAIAMAEARPPT